MTIDTPTLLAQIDQLARMIDDATAAELEAGLEYAFDETTWPPGKAPDHCLAGLTTDDKDYREGFLAGMVWAVVLHRRGATMLGLMRLPDAEVLRQAADIFERHYPDDSYKISHTLMCLAREYHDGHRQDGE